MHGRKMFGMSSLHLKQYTVMILFPQNRKNPLHFKEYLHPDKDSSDDDDDDDDKVAGDDSDDYRPVCPYGSSCYRQNPQHRKDFEHTDAVGRLGSVMICHAALIRFGMSSAATCRCNNPNRNCPKLV